MRTGALSFGSRLSSDTYDRLRSLNGKCWDASSFVLRQLEGIGEKSASIPPSSPSSCLR